jgi:hypothetical protein
MEKKIVLKAMEQLIHSPEWSIVKSQLVEEKNALLNKLMVNSINWNESQIKAMIESIKVYDNIIDCPDRIFQSYGGQLTTEE